VLLKVCDTRGFIESTVLWVIVSGVGFVTMRRHGFWGGGRHPKGAPMGALRWGWLPYAYGGLKGISNGTTTMTRM